MKESLNDLPPLDINFKCIPQHKNSLVFNYEVASPVSQITNKLQDRKFKRWDEEEQLRYFIFVEYHWEKLKNKDSRLPFKTFKLMAKFIETRSCDQCRSHHQKITRIGLKQKLDDFKVKHPNFQTDSIKLQGLLIKQEDASFYLDCDSGYTESCKQIGYQGNQNKIEKQSPAITQATAIKGKGMSRLQYLSEYKALIYYYEKWKKQVEELMQQENQQIKQVNFQSIQKQVENNRQYCPNNLNHLISSSSGEKPIQMHSFSNKQQNLKKQIQAPKYPVIVIPKK